MYRRPSELGLSTTPMEDKSEVKRNYVPVAGGRQHIVKPIPDHKETYQAAVEEWEEEDNKETESSSHYKNLAPRRPVCQKLNDHLTLGVSETVCKLFWTDSILILSLLAFLQLLINSWNWLKHRALSLMFESGLDCISEVMRGEYFIKKPAKWILTSCPTCHHVTIKTWL